MADPTFPRGCAWYTSDNNTVRLNTAVGAGSPAAVLLCALPTAMGAPTYACAHAGVCASLHRCAEWPGGATGGGSLTTAIAAGVGGALAMLLLGAAAMLFFRARARHTATQSVPMGLAHAPGVPMSPEFVADAPLKTMQIAY